MLLLRRPISQVSTKTSNSCAKLMLRYIQHQGLVAVLRPKLSTSLEQIPSILRYQISGAMSTRWACSHISMPSTQRKSPAWFWERIIPSQIRPFQIIFSYSRGCLRTSLTLLGSFPMLTIQCRGKCNTLSSVNKGSYDAAFISRYSWSFLCSTA